MWYKNIEDLENLPLKEGRKAYITRKYGDMWNLPKFDHGWYRSDGQYSWKIARRIAKSFIGKSFDDAFSKYCKLVPIYEQREFLDLFEPRKFRYWKPEFSVDKDKNIIYTPYQRHKRKKDLVFHSIDYEEGWRKRSTKEIFDDSITNKPEFWLNPKRFEKILINGYWIEFENYNEKQFVRLRKEKSKQKRLQYKRYKKYLKEKEYSFIRDCEIKNVA